MTMQEYMKEHGHDLPEDLVFDEDTPFPYHLEADGETGGGGRENRPLSRV